MSTPTYSATQLVYCFTFSVNSAAGLAFDNTGGTGLATMQAYVNTVATQVLSDTLIQGLIGNDWTPVWGPVVYCADTSGPTVHADNTMGCYYSPSNGLFVIAVAGTNPNSLFDWLDEDFEVGSLVSWASISGSGSGNVSKATASGLHILLNLADKNGSTLLAALSAYCGQQNINTAQVAVGGHSLAGALSPCLALYMHSNPQAWNPSGQFTIGAYPSAGPTPGDNVFAAYYASVISQGGIKYSSLYNSLDVVPLAWAEDDLETIPTIYDANIVPPEGSNPTDVFMSVIACGLQLNAAQAAKGWFHIPKNPYTQVSLGRSAMTGTFNTTVDSGVTSQLQHVDFVLPGTLKAYAPYLTGVVRFAAQAIAQHTVAYPPLLDIVAFNAEYQLILKKNAPSSAVKTDPVRAAVKKLAKVDLSNLDGEALAKAAAAAPASTQ